MAINPAKRLTTGCIELIVTIALTTETPADVSAKSCCVMSIFYQILIFELFILKKSLIYMDKFGFVLTRTPLKNTKKFI